MKRLIYTILFLLYCGMAFAASDTFPPSSDRPVVDDFLSPPFNNTYYCSPSGNNTTGTGSSGNPWLDLRGATSGGAGTAITGGDLLYLRGGDYPDTAASDSEYSRSLNCLQRDGSSGSPIVITNYPGEIAKWDDVTTWSLTLRGDYIKLIGTMVGSSYGIQITGGATFHEGDYVQISNVEFIGGTSNGGDLNPAMLADPLNGTSQVDVIISHNYFHDSAYVIAQERMRCIGIFVTTDVVIEYNRFKDNEELLEEAGCILIKDAAHGTTVRYNTFVNCVSGISYCSQGNDFGGLDFHHNLMYDVDQPFFFSNDLTNGSEEINIYSNVALAITTAFFTYFNNDNQDWTEHGDYYDNIIDGTAFYLDWPDNADDEKNIPDFFDYNLWYDSGDQNTPATWTIPSAYHDNAVVSNGCVTYNSETMTATVADDYAGLGEGRYGGNIGGFAFSAYGNASSNGAGSAAGNGAGSVTMQ